MLNAVTDALSTVLGWVGSVVTSLVTGAGEGTAAGDLNPLLSMFAVGVAISAVLLGVRIIKSVVWGA